MKLLDKKTLGADLCNNLRAYLKTIQDLNKKQLKKDEINYEIGELQKDQATLKGRITNLDTRRIFIYESGGYIYQIDLNKDTVHRLELVSL